MAFMTRRDVILFNDNRGLALGKAVIEAYNKGYPIKQLFADLNIEFDSLFNSEYLGVQHDVCQEGIEEVVLWDRDSLMYVRPNGVVMITFRNSNAVESYRGNGVFDVVTTQVVCNKYKRQHRTISLSPETLQPYFWNGGECR